MLKHVATVLIALSGLVRAEPENAQTKAVGLAAHLTEQGDKNGLSLFLKFLIEEKNVEVLHSVVTTIHTNREDAEEAVLIILKSEKDIYVSEILQELFTGPLKLTEKVKLQVSKLQNHANSEISAMAKKCLRND